MRSFCYVIAIAALVLSSGCDLFGSEEDGTIVVTGTVVLAETGEPTKGLGVSLDKGGTFTRIVVATTRTDADGAFTISYDATGSRSTHILTINDEPYDPRYSVTGTSLVRGEHLDLGVIELEETESP